MIYARDWRIFLDNGISISELPIPSEHMDYCKQYMANKELYAKAANFDFSAYRRAYTRGRSFGAKHFKKQFYGGKNGESTERFKACKL